MAEAHRMVATAERLRDQPKTRDAMRRGELSDDEADAVSGATEADPEGEAEHLRAAAGRPSACGGDASGAGPSGGGGPGGSAGAAGPSGDDSAGPGAGDGSEGPARDGAGGGRRESIAELRRRRERARARADRDGEARERRLHEERSASKGPTAEGGFFLRANITRDGGLRVSRGLDVALREVQAERRAQGLAPLTYGQAMADALVRMADKSLEPAASSGPGPRTRAVLLADVAALERGWAAGDETCEIPGVGPVSVPAAKALLGDAALTLVLRRGIDIRNLTNLGDTFTDAQRAAIWARAQGVCETPGCGATSGLEIDHGHEVQYGGPSHVDNGRLHCWVDHQAKSHGGMRLVGPPGRRAWVHVDELPRDPAKTGPIPVDDLEHLLPPPAATRPATTAGREPPDPPAERPAAGEAGRRGPDQRGSEPHGSDREPARGDQLHLLPT